MSTHLAQPLPLEEENTGVEGWSRRLESPYIVFPSLILLLIMPLGIVFHPAWLATLAEVGVVVMFIAIFRMMRM
ncbi:hypothetical protein JHL17_13760 [Azospirillum sp. YIM B02556]|uniref:Uncharacterized protein n=1 Tax=Azospirillum endophyticum TaxID=2800326 RepID=A0ABS1F4Z4_9PROT|nr:hypothetical protein [Azospirillum endophyticum]MBK1838481.1 hypothetical protein [Azospirillum endophyticum]